MNKQAEADFTQQNQSKACRYFKRGMCLKGNMCRFSHNFENQTTNFTPYCARGQQCIFLQQNRCHFFHPGVGVQMPHSQSHAFNQTSAKECRYKDQCRNIQSCEFTHPSQVFQYVQLKNRRHIGVKQMNIWKNY